MQEESSLNFADRFSRAIARAGLKPARISELTGISKGYLSELLSGGKRGPSPETAKKLAEVLGVSPEWLVHGSVQESAGSYANPKDEPDTISNVMREEPGTYRVTRGPGAVPLRQPDEPTIMERLAAMEREREETRASLAAIKQALDDLTDLFTNRKPRG